MTDLDLARQLETSIQAAAIARAQKFTSEELALAVFGPTPPPSQRLARLRYYLDPQHPRARAVAIQNGARAVNDRVGLRLLSALGLKELKPVWGAAAPLPGRQRAPRPTTAAPTGDTYHDRLALALGQRLRDLGVTYEDVAQAAFGPKGRASQVRRYLDGTLTPLSPQGVRLMGVLGLKDLKPVWG